MLQSLISSSSQYHLHDSIQSVNHNILQNLYINSTSYHWIPSYTKKGIAEAVPFYC
ncbi:hypothetical protein MITSMUL_05259 [Mitsuokella multacida DSM 20544]|uniref:Uncharacterized protein n=1 Tax=Mitsuokella multacida DSM 20544 TaxID=500635 RepID=C9KPV0_9FIRM|nr:hypothetical protein MITSMUL_05259 [Mitsuokella multacida DSM 20544]